MAVIHRVEIKPHFENFWSWVPRLALPVLEASALAAMCEITIRNRTSREGSIYAEDRFKKTVATLELLKSLLLGLQLGANTPVLAARLSPVYHRFAAYLQSEDKDFRTASYGRMVSAATGTADDLAPLQVKWLKQNMAWETPDLYEDRESTALMKGYDEARMWCPAVNESELRNSRLAMQELANTQLSPDVIYPFYQVACMVNAARHLGHKVVVKGKKIMKGLLWHIIPREGTVVCYCGSSRGYNHGMSDDPTHPITILTYHLRDVHCFPFAGMTDLVDGKYLSPQE